MLNQFTSIIKCLIVYSTLWQQQKWVTPCCLAEYDFSLELAGNEISLRATNTSNQISVKTLEKNQSHQWEELKRAWKTMPNILVRSCSILFEVTLASYSNESISFKWEWPILSLLLTIFDGRKRQEGSIHFVWTILSYSSRAFGKMFEEIALNFRLLLLALLCYLRALFYILKLIEFLGGLLIRFCTRCFYFLNWNLDIEWRRLTPKGKIQSMNNYAILSSSSTLQEI